MLTASKKKRGKKLIIAVQQIGEFFVSYFIYFFIFFILDGSQREHVCLAGGRLECPPHILETTSERFLEYLSQYQLNIINKVKKIFFETLNMLEVKRTAFPTHTHNLMCSFFLF